MADDQMVILFLESARYARTRHNTHAYSIEEKSDATAGIDCCCVAAYFDDFANDTDGAVLEPFEERGIDTGGLVAHNGEKAVMWWVVGWVDAFLLCRRVQWVVATGLSPQSLISGSRPNAVWIGLTAQFWSRDITRRTNYQ